MVFGKEKPLPSADAPFKKSAGDAGILGLGQVTTEAMKPIAHLDEEWTLEEIAWKVAGFIGRAACKYWESSDKRLEQKATVMQALSIIEEFAESAMLAIAGACCERTWFTEANFTTPLYHAAITTFEDNKKFLVRVVKPLIQRTIEDIVYRFKEEERIQKHMWDSVLHSGLPAQYHRKAFGHLQKSYDFAHMNADYGIGTGDTPEMGLVMDFTKCWMTTFASRSWLVLEQGISKDKEEQFAFLTTLFQHVTDPKRLCLPNDLVSQPGAMPPEAWSFVSETSMSIVRGGDAEDGEFAAEDPFGESRKRKAGGGAARNGSGKKRYTGSNGGDWPGEDAAAEPRLGDLLEAGLDNLGA